MYIPRPKQIEKANKALPILRAHHIVYLAMEERTGKSLTALLVCEEYVQGAHVLVLTKKKPINGWLDTLKNYLCSNQYTVTNYHQAAKLTKEQIKQFKVVILDEAHAYLAAFPKRGAIWKAVKAITRGKPLIYISATPYAQGPHMLYNQLALSDYTPFRAWPSPYVWFAKFGIPETIWISGRQVETYKKTKEVEVLKHVELLFVKGTRKEMGFKQEPKDKKHYIELGENVKEAYNIIIKKRVLEVNGHTLVCDTPMKLRTALHMLEGGTLKIGDNYLVLDTVMEKINYIKKYWGDTNEVVIMYNYIAEGRKLRKHFKNAEILQGTTYAEGVDLYHKKYLIIYSQNFSTSGHTQRRARQTNLKREEDIEVHYLLVKDAVSDQCYNTTAENKVNFVDSLFEKKALE